MNKVKYTLFRVTISSKSVEWWNDKQERLPTGNPRSKKLKVDPHIVEKEIESFMQSKFWMKKYKSESFRIIVSIENHIPIFNLITIASSLIAIYRVAKKDDILQKIRKATTKEDLLNYSNYIFEFVLEEDVKKSWFRFYQKLYKKTVRY